MTRWNWGHLLSPLFTVYTFDFIVNSSYQYPLKLFVIIIQTLSMTLSMFSIEFLTSVNGNSAALNTVYHSTVVGTIIFGFLLVCVWPVNLQLKSSLCVGDLLRHHTGGDLHWVICLIRNMVWSCLPQWSKMAGWEHMSVYLWNLLASDLGMLLNCLFKAEISLQVFKLLCFVGICLFLDNFPWFLGKVKARLGFSMCFCYTIWITYYKIVNYCVSLVLVTVFHLESLENGVLHSWGMSIPVMRQFSWFSDLVHFNTVSSHFM